MSADEVGVLVLKAIRENIFFLPTDPQVRDRLVKRAEDVDAFLQDQLDHPHLIDLTAIQRAREQAASENGGQNSRRET